LVKFLPVTLYFGNQDRIFFGYLNSFIFRRRVAGPITPWVQDLQNIPAALQFQGRRHHLRDERGAADGKYEETDL